MQNVAFSVIGHSIGAYIGLEASKVLLDQHQFSVESIVALFPFLRVDHSNTRQRVIRFACNYLRQAIGIIIFILSYLPNRALLSIFRLLGFRNEMHNMQSMLLLIRKHVALNAFYMGMTEFKQLNGPTNWEVLELFQDRLAVIGAPNDDWFSKEQMEQIQRRLPSVPVFWEVRQCHAFVVSDSMCIECAKRTLEAYQRINFV
eukprot:TRINITY_DN63388_c0_g1_i1.p1 TRINITY_DN63388_c0_g1~~TRINITY_DN63388_c0_g1_i1.p1  ORF type:complete len:202 (-),score=19.39 TRINITY_DN63388_c0_g1_i1:245-850(-)